MGLAALMIVISQVSSTEENKMHYGDLAAIDHQLPDVFI